MISSVRGSVLEMAASVVRMTVVAAVVVSRPIVRTLAIVLAAERRCACSSETTLSIVYTDRIYYSLHISIMDLGFESHVQSKACLI